MNGEFADCLVLNTVMAARALTRHYDKVLKPFGISVVQLTVLMVLHNTRNQSMNRMAADISMDRTTLLRNVEVLMRAGLVEARPVDRGYGRDFSLTQKGAALLVKVIPMWRDAQNDIRLRLGTHNPGEFLGALRALSDR